MTPPTVVRRLFAALGLAIAGCAEPPPPAAPTAAPIASDAPPESGDAALIRRCVAGSLDTSGRAAIAKLLSESRDPSLEPCLAKLLESYDVSVADDGIRYVCRAVSAMKPKSVAGPLLSAFKKMRASHENARGATRDMVDAMRAVADPSWEPELSAILDRPVSWEVVAKATDELFWQTTAATLLGQMKSERAVRPLFRVLLSSSKGVAHVDAALALVAIGKPAGAAAAAMLARGDAELAAYAEAQMGAGSEKATGAQAVAGRAAMVLGAIGRADATTAMLDALASPDPLTRALIARELPKLPKDARVVEAFRRVYEKTPLELSIPNARGWAPDELAERAAELYDPSLVPFLLDDLKRRRGGPGPMRALRETAFATALTLARADQIKLLDAAAKQGKRGETPNDLFKKEIAITKALLAACGDRVDCWVDRLLDPAAQKAPTQFQGVKAAAMIAARGDAAAKAKLVDALPQMTSNVVRFATLMAIDHLSPEGDLAAAKALQAMVDDAVATKDQARLAAIAPVKQVILRLSARVP